MIRIRATSFAALVVAASIVTACSDVTAPSTGAFGVSSFSKSGTTTGGGGTTGGTSTGGGSTTPSSTSGPPVAPTYVGRITAIGEIPAGLYYGTPSDWYVGGYLFKSAYLSSFKPANGPIVVGACVSVSFVESDGVYLMSELKTLIDTKCN